MHNFQYRALTDVGIHISDSTKLDPPNFRLADHKQITDQTRPDQYMMTPKIEFRIYSINIVACC